MFFGDVVVSYFLVLDFFDFFIIFVFVFVSNFGVGFLVFVSLFFFFVFGIEGCFEFVVM